MKEKIIKTYLICIIITISISIVAHFLFLVKIDDFYTKSLEDLTKIKDSYYEIKTFENSYIIKQSPEKLLYINDKYLFFEEKLDLFSLSLKDRGLLFSLMEIKEISLKHKESFFRTIVYLRDTKNKLDEDSYNLEKSMEIMKNQNDTFNKKTEKFLENLNGFVKEEKVRREKISFTLFLVFFSILTLSLKYNLIWGENDGYSNCFKKGKD